MSWTISPLTRSNGTGGGVVGGGVFDHMIRDVRVLVCLDSCSCKLQISEANVLNMTFIYVNFACYDSLQMTVKKLLGSEVSWFPPSWR